MTTLLPLPRIRTADPVGERGATRSLADAYGRVATDLRVSLTDRCNLRCQYCMPAEGLDWLPRDEVLTNEEIIRLIRVGVTRLGITTVRLTGGEPLLRPDLEWLVAAIADLRPAPVIALTTNGIGLAERASRLADAGLDRINVSLDTLDPTTFKRITRRPRLADVLAGVDAAAGGRADPGQDQQRAAARRERPRGVPAVGVGDAHRRPARFIEQMPLDAQHAWNRQQMITADEIRARLSEQVQLVEDPADRERRGSAPAELFRVSDTGYAVGIIASVSKPFCGSCDRVRLTADGQLRNCLFARTESDLRTPLRAGATDDELADQWVRAVAGKRAGHGIDDPTFLQPDRPMSAIGG